MREFYTRVRRLISEETAMQSQADLKELKAYTLLELLS
jgi:hypothetical protein